MPRSLLLTLALALSLLLLVSSPTAAQPPGGFLNIDCGYGQLPNQPSNYTDTTVSSTLAKPIWLADTGYVAGGTATQVDSNYTANIKQNNGTDLQTLRYFNDTTQSKSCYRLPVVSGNLYLLRAGFLYGNYDELNVLPMFDVALDATLWATVIISDVAKVVYLENIFSASNASVASVCLIKRKDTGHVPFINSLELRLLPGNAYIAAGNHLHVLKRINFGGSTIRYPSDKIDRIWENGTLAAPDLSGLSTLSNFNFNSYYESRSDPPGVVLEQAITAPNISFSLSAPSTPFTATFRLFFAEINNSLSFDYRAMAVQVGDLSGLVNLTMLNSSGLLEKVEKDFPSVSLPGGAVKVTLTKVDSSPLDPLLNAMEAFAITPALLGTDYGDKETLITLSQAAGLADWVGDPCLPVSWTEIGCSSEADLVHVILLNLTSKNLNGPVPEAIGALSSLKILDLSNNRLSGDFPTWLVNLSNLIELSIENNNIAGRVPSDLLCKPGLKFRYGGNPSLITSTSLSCGNVSSGSTSKSGANVGVVAGAVVAAVAVIAIVGGLIFWQRKVKGHCLGDAEVALMHSNREAQIQDLDIGSVRKVHHIRRMSEAEIREATNSYRTPIAEGVFYGKLKDNREVAVKVFPEVFEEGGGVDFAKEVSALSEVEHKNILPLLGFCSEGNPRKRMLVYEYMEGRDLHRQLHGPVTEHSAPLSWTDRINIALDTAAGLDYLHNGGSRPILHLNVKSNNILVNRKLTAKVANYWRPQLRRKESIGGEEEIRGTLGYLDPESIVAGEWTSKSDVYSFGVLLLELVCGRKPFSLCPPYGTGLHIVDWVRQSMLGGDPAALVDPALGKSYNTLALQRYVNLALQCTDWDSRNRPDMSAIVRELHEISRIDLEHRAA